MYLWSSRRCGLRRVCRAIREGIAQHVFTVSSGDFMSIYASNNLFKGIKKYSNNGGALLGRIIAIPSLKVIPERSLTISPQDKDADNAVCAPFLTVTQSELKGKTTIESATDSQQARSTVSLPSGS
jgi:nitrogenase iron protein NifH